MWAKIYIQGKSGGGGDERGIPGPDWLFMWWDSPPHVREKKTQDASSQIWAICSPPWRPRAKAVPLDLSKRSKVSSVESLISTLWNIPPPQTPEVALPFCRWGKKVTNGQHDRWWALEKCYLKYSNTRADMVVPVILEVEGGAIIRR